MLNALRDSVEPDAVLSDNIFGYLWGKAGYGAILKSSALTNDSIADFIGLREADVIQIILKAFYLLRKRHLKKPEFNFRLFLPTERKQYR